jgi:hypothetical protein
MRRLFPLLGVLGLLVSFSPARCQQNLPPLPQPRLQTVFPAGGKVGTTVEVTFAGTDLEEPEALLFSHPGLRAEAIVPPAPPEPKNPDPKKPAPKPPMPPAKPAVTKFKVTISRGTPLGSHDVRLVNKWGVSNPRAFTVGDLNEIEEKEPNNDVGQAQKVEINTVINGVINAPTDVDYFRFAGRRGQRVLFHVAGSSIDSKVRPAVEVYDAAGKRLVFNRNYRDLDALADLTLPADGDFIVRLYEFTHTAGNQDCYYRLSITTAPWIDAVVPPMVEPGKSATVTVYGRNLPGGQPDPTAITDGVVLEKITTTVTAPAEAMAQQRLAYSGRVDPAASSLDGFEYRIAGPGGSSNPYLLMFARAPVVLEKEPNDRPEGAQAVSAPCEIAGHIGHRNDFDWYAFDVKKGEVYTVELFGDRIGSPADFYFSVKPADPKAGSLGEFDDNQDLLHPFQFYTRTSDPPVFRLQAQADSKYLVMVSSRDAGTEYGPRHLYRLRISPEKPDFRLIVMPHTSNRAEGTVLRSDGQQLFDVFVWREDGFTAPITLSVEGLPAGVICSPQQVAPGQKQSTLVLSAAANAAPAVTAITVKGTAVVNGQTVIREARPATITWTTQPGQNLPTISRLDRQTVVAVRDKAPYRVAPKADVLTVKQGDKTTLNFTVTRLWPEFKGQVAVQAMTLFNNQPLLPGVVFNNNQPVNVAPDKNEGSGSLTIGSNVAPGVYTLVLRGTAQHQFEKVPKGPKVNSGLLQPSAPITLTVVPASLGTLQASAPGNAKIGATAEVVVKVTRLHNYTGEYKLKVVLPADVKAVSADETTIPTGKDEAKLVLKIAGDAKPGNLPNLVVQATAQFEGKTPITSEAKFNLNVVK